jgi:hypothetical protein
MITPRSALVLVVFSVVLLSVAGVRDGAEGDAAVKTPCAWVDSADPKPAADLGTRAEAYVRVELAPDLGHLDATERAVLDDLVAAGEIMDELFRIQATPCYEELAALVGAHQGPDQDALARYFAINYGPWDRRLHYEPYFGGWPHPEGANFYPLDLTEAEQKSIADPAAGLNGLTTMVRRDQAGRLEAIAYGRFFGKALTEAGGHLRAAAAHTQNVSLKAFLDSRADAFVSDDYYASDVLWMDVDSPVEVTIGPYETYEDGLFGFKASFEAFVTVTDPVQSQRLARFKDELPWLEQRLPLPDADKNPNRGSESPIRVVDLVYSGGDTRAGVQTIAFNLPNDERVREAKGSKKVLMRNVMDAKFRNILTPIAERLVVAEQLADVTPESFFLHTLWHEMSHGLGPGRIVVDGRETEVRLEHKDLYSTIEEAKADLMGIWDILALQAAGRDYFPARITRQQPATYLAGLFRSVRFGIGEAHGAANAIQFNCLLEKGAIVLDEASGKFRVDHVRFFPAVESLLREVLTVQARGDYAGAAALVKTYAVMPPSLARALERLEGIPVDIQPVFTHYPDS